MTSLGRPEFPKERRRPVVPRAAHAFFPRLFPLGTFFLATVILLNLPDSVRADEVVVTVRRANVRAGGSLRARVVDRIDSGSRFTLLDAKRGWYFVQSFSGRTFWISGTVSRRIRARAWREAEIAPGDFLLVRKPDGGGNIIYTALDTRTVLDPGRFADYLRSPPVIALDIDRFARTLLPGSRITLLHRKCDTPTRERIRAFLLERIEKGFTPSPKFDELLEGGAPPSQARSLDLFFRTAAFGKETAPVEPTIGAEKAAHRSKRKETENHSERIGRPPGSSFFSPGPARRAAREEVTGRLPAGARVLEYPFPEEERRLQAFLDRLELSGSSTPAAALEKIAKADLLAGLTRLPESPDTEKTLVQISFGPEEISFGNASRNLGSRLEAINRKLLEHDLFVALFPDKKGLWQVDLLRARFAPLYGIDLWVVTKNANPRIDLDDLPPMVTINGRIFAVPDAMLVYRRLLQAAAPTIWKEYETGIPHFEKMAVGDVSEYGWSILANALTFQAWGIETAIPAIGADGEDRSAKQ
ncbi:MAG: hypothetical protein D6679_01260 [Candidatus Hydrogenedentota bacterium]|nr:MAG: hypothetical protein D6679_01260 [Candidatus Hydrogenedentota bacterium]